MTNAQDLVKMLQSEQPKARYDACEQLMLLPVLTQDVIDALSIAAHDGDSSVAKAARRALELHKSDVLFSKDTIATLNASVNQSVQRGTISQIEEKIKLGNMIKSGASNFYWIAALSLINSFVVLVGGNWNFFIGLGITQLVDGIFMAIAKSVGNGSASTIQIIGFIINIFFSGMFVTFGIFSHKQKKWAFIAGMVLYALDSLIFLLVLDLFSIGFHIFILFGIFTGWSAMKKHEELMKQISA